MLEIMTPALRELPRDLQEAFSNAFVAENAHRLGLACLTALDRVSAHLQMCGSAGAVRQGSEICMRSFRLVELLLESHVQTGGRTLNREEIRDLARRVSHQKVDVILELQATVKRLRRFSEDAHVPVVLERMKTLLQQVHRSQSMFVA